MNSRLIRGAKRAEARSGNERLMCRIQAATRRVAATTWIIFVVADPCVGLASRHVDHIRSGR